MGRRRPVSPEAGFLAAILVAGWASVASAQSVPEAVPFDPAAVVAGIEIGRSDCARLEASETAIWVAAGGVGACLRYYAAGLVPAPGPNPIASLWLNGDVLGPRGENAEKRQKGFGPTEMVAQERRLAARFGVPSIFLGRPGTYGSGGRHHSMRGRPIEAKLVDAAIDGLARRYGIRAWSLAGHSGGGTLVAELLARRRALRCAVLSSGASAHRAYLEARGLIGPGEVSTRFDPSASLDRVPADANRRIFVIGDPRETNVPFSSQKLYFDGLVARGHMATLVPLEKATDARHHDLVDFAETASGLCATGVPTEAIVSTLVAMPEQPSRRTN